MNENHDPKTGEFSSGDGSGAPKTPAGHQGDLFGVHQQMDQNTDTAHAHTNSPEYERASATARAESKIFGQAQADYRAKKIGDKEYMAARVRYDKSTKAFDQAFAKEAGGQ